MERRSRRTGCPVDIAAVLTSDRSVRGTEPVIPGVNIMGCEHLSQSPRRPVRPCTIGGPFVPQYACSHYLGKKTLLDLGPRRGEIRPKLRLTGQPEPAGRRSDHQTHQSDAYRSRTRS